MYTLKPIEVVTGKSRVLFAWVKGGVWSYLRILIGMGFKSQMEKLS